MHSAAAARSGAGLLRQDDLGRVAAHFAVVATRDLAQSSQTLADDGYAPLDQVLRALRNRHSIADVRHVVETSRHDDGAPRFQLHEEADRPPKIRATRRHSIAGVGPGPHASTPHRRRLRGKGPPGQRGPPDQQGTGPHRIVVQGAIVRDDTFR